ncbi:aldehyde dehydrogenase family protein [Streptomyces sp. HB132]|uniref:aldehyde dehydrogenase family protein n=1 Tax=Streptomyces sp. HB132 TaxID=767388 RepID=UPI001D1DF8FA|nr:acyl-CoA reductase-like NAD-dependent aldehyde dehydrogenase [Streptomyces sp. HB132]
MTTGTNPAEQTIEDIRAAVARARSAGRSWAALGARERRTWLLRWKRELACRTDEFDQVIASETGKPVHDARAEVLLTLVHLGWAARNARLVLGRRRVPSGLLSVHQRALPAYRPLGVSGPWNYPLHTPMGSINYALAWPGPSSWAEAARPVLRTVTRR